MTEETRKQILEWVYDNHQHHAGAKSVSMDLDTGKVTENDGESECWDGDKPYVNSLDLETFIKEL